MTIAQMKERKRELGLSNQEISLRSDIPVSTLQKIFSGKTRSPRQDTIEALERILRPAPYAYMSSEKPPALREAQAAYAISGKKQGEYTLEDYYAIPDERRVELIDGVIYDMSAPSILHQRILGELFMQFQACTAAHDGQCEVYFAPCDVQLDMDNRTMLQPDLFVICRDFDRTARAFLGAPDLCVEILSSYTRSRDMLLKLAKYHNAGVREYWIVDPKNKEVFVYDFEDVDFKPIVYPFDSRIPIRISKGTCSIDFARINQVISPYYA